MKLSKRTLDILKNYASINQSMLFKQGNILTTVSPMHSVFAKATVEESFPLEFGIFNLNQFLSVLSLLGENEITFNDNNLVIKTGDQNVKYIYADPSTIDMPSINDIPLQEELISLSLSSEALNHINKALGVLGLHDVAIVGKKGEYSVQVLDPKGIQKNVFSLDIVPTAGELVQPDKSFMIIFNAENFKIIQDNYQVEIRRMKKGYAGKFKSENGPEYVIAVAVESTI